jgi:hypothetical protein
MLKPSIMELIRRRRDGFRQRSGLLDDARERDRNLRIAEEYDALIAEIERSGYSTHDAHPVGAMAAGVEIEDPSEQWILGDQGQLGG